MLASPAFGEKMYHMILSHCLTCHLGLAHIAVTWSIYEYIYYGGVVQNILHRINLQYYIYMNTYYKKILSKPNFELLQNVFLLGG